MFTRNEPWVRSVGCYTFANTRLVTLGPIPVGVVIENLRFSTISAGLINFRLQLSRGDVPARTVGDMIGQDLLFKDVDTQISNGPLAVGGRTWSVATDMMRIGWGFRVQAGPQWISCALQSLTAQVLTMIFTAEGYRLVENEGCRFEKT